MVLVAHAMKLPGESKVANLNRAVVHDEQVGRLDVSVHDSSRVNELEAT